MSEQVLVGARGFVEIRAGVTVPGYNAKKKWDGTDSFEVEKARGRAKAELASKLLDWFAYHSGQSVVVIIQSDEITMPNESVYVLYKAVVKIEGGSIEQS